MTFKTFAICILVCTVNIGIFAQDSDVDGVGNIGIEMQAYPTGILPGIRFEYYTGASHAINIRLGLQFFNHRDLGVQDDEKGNGYGLSVGYNYYFGPKHTRWSLGMRVDGWKNKVDWETNAQKGTTNIFVLQPTAIGAYTFSNGTYSFSPSLGFGFEWNVVSEGNPTGQGAILLGGVTLTRILY